MLVEVVSEVLRAPMDSTSEVFKDSRDLSLLVVWGEGKRLKHYGSCYVTVNQANQINTLCL